MKKLLLVLATGALLTACSREAAPAPTPQVEKVEEVDPEIAAMIPPAEFIYEYKMVEITDPVPGPFEYSKLHAHVLDQ